MLALGRARSCCQSHYASPPPPVYVRLTPAARNMCICLKGPVLASCCCVKQKLSLVVYCVLIPTTQSACWPQACRTRHMQLPGRTILDFLSFNTRFSPLLVQARLEPALNTCICLGASMRARALLQHCGPLHSLHLERMPEQQNNDSKQQQSTTNTCRSRHPLVHCHNYAAAAATLRIYSLLLCAGGGVLCEKAHKCSEALLTPTN